MVPMLRWGLLRSNFAFAMSSFSLLASDASDDLSRDRLGRLLIRVELHGVRRATLRARTQISSVAEHFCERYVRADHLTRPSLVHPLDLSAPGRQVADDVAHVVLGSHHLDRHD